MCSPFNGNRSKEIKVSPNKKYFGLKKESKQNLCENDDDKVVGEDDDDKDEDGDQVVGAPKPEELLLRVFLVRFRQRGLSWSVIPAMIIISCLLESL